MLARLFFAALSNLSPDGRLYRSILNRFDIQSDLMNDVEKLRPDIVHLARHRIWCDYAAGAKLWKDLGVCYELLEYSRSSVST